MLSSDNIRAYLLVILGIIVVILLYYLLLGPAVRIPISYGRPPQGPPGSPSPSDPGMAAFNIWPLWGQLVLPTPYEVAISITIMIIFGIIVKYFLGRTNTRSRVILMTIIGVGVLLIIATNLIHGWQIGIEYPISGPSEIFQDIFKVKSIFDFISNYDVLQPTLTVHAQTHPPGAVLSIYFLYSLFKTPSLIAIGLCVIAGIGSALFLRGIFCRLFDEDYAQYTVFLYLILPAVQIYYLANIYAFVATLTFGVLYFYFHPERKTAAIGTFVCLFLLTFLTFLSAFIVLFLFLYELLMSWSRSHSVTILSKLKDILASLLYPFLLSLSIVGIYLLLFIAFKFSYINAFLYASSLENPNGFRLFSNPAEYIITRVQNILDIIIFFGPVLSVLAYRGFQILRREATKDENLLKKYNLVISSLIALAILFLAGAPKKGETARICMFVLPFFLIPVITYLWKTNMSPKEKSLLLLLVFGQTVLLQLFGIWIW